MHDRNAEPRLEETHCETECANDESRSPRSQRNLPSAGSANAASGAASMGPPSPAEDFSATLLTMAGHDLRQPLQLIVGAHDKLARTLQGSEQQAELAHAGAAIAQLVSMLSQLVEAVQLRHRSGDDLHLPVPLRPLLDGLVAEFAKPARQKGITFRVISGRGAVLSHSVLLTGMLRNLIRNAIDYTPPGGAVFVTCRRCGPKLRIEVSDTGTGIRANALSAIFNGFQRNDESRADGLGLGLFIVKQAADLLGHRIEVRSAEGRGSCFAIIADAARRSAAIAA